MCHISITSFNVYLHAHVLYGGIAMKSVTSLCGLPKFGYTPCRAPTGGAAPGCGLRSCAFLSRDTVFCAAPVYIAWLGYFSGIGTPPCFGTWYCATLSHFLAWTLWTVVIPVCLGDRVSYCGACGGSAIYGNYRIITLFCRGNGNLSLRWENLENSRYPQFFV